MTSSSCSARETAVRSAPEGRVVGSCGHASMLAGMSYPWIAGAGVTSCPLRIAGAGAGAKSSVLARIFVVNIRADFTRCHY
jgi:hypothetical protein